MIELGQMLRDARQSKGVSLAEAEEATKIRRKYLEALEATDYDSLPPSVYSRGFLRSYATYLGLDPEAALDAYHDGAQAHTDPREPQIISEPLVPGSRVNWELVAGVLMLDRRGRHSVPRLSSIHRTSGDTGGRPNRDDNHRGSGPCARGHAGPRS